MTWKQSERSCNGNVVTRRTEYKAGRLPAFSFPKSRHQCLLKRAPIQGWLAPAIAAQQILRPSGQHPSDFPALTLPLGITMLSYPVVSWRIQAITAASARCSMGMRFVLATVALPTGVA